MSRDICAALNAAENPSATNEFMTHSAVTALISAKCALSDYQNVIVVDPGGCGDYTTLGAAMAAITTASSTNKFLIIVYGKTVETANITWKRYVYAVGGGPYAEVSGAFSILFVAGSYGDQIISGLTISMALGTAAVSAHVVFQNCILSGGLVQSHASMLLYFMSCKYTGKLNGNSLAGQIFFYNCAVTATSPWSVRTQVFYGGTLAASGFVANGNYITVNGTAITYSGASLTIPAGCSMKFYNVPVLDILHVIVGGELILQDTSISELGAGADVLSILGGSTVILIRSTVENTSAAANSLGARILNTSSDPTKFLAVHSYFNGDTVGIDSDAAYIAQMFQCTMKGIPSNLTAAATTALSSNDCF